MIIHLRQIFTFLKNEIRTAMQDHKNAFDLASIGATLGALAGWLPAIASLLSIIWMAIRIYETDTVQRILGREPIQNTKE